MLMFSNTFLYMYDVCMQARCPDFVLRLVRIHNWVTGFSRKILHKIRRCGQGWWKRSLRWVDLVELHRMCHPTMLTVPRSEHRRCERQTPLEREAVMRGLSSWVFGGVRRSTELDQSDCLRLDVGLPAHNSMKVPLVDPR